MIQILLFRLITNKLIFGIIVFLINISAFSQNNDIDSIAIDLEENTSANKKIPPSPFNQVRKAYDKEGYLQYIDNFNYSINSKENGFGKVNVKPYSLSFNFGISSVKSSFDSIISTLVSYDLIDSIWIQTFGEGRPEPKGVIVLIGSKVDTNIVKILFEFFKKTKMDIKVLSLFDYNNDYFMDNRTISIGSFISGETKNMLVVKEPGNIRRILDSETHEQLIDRFYEFNENKNISKVYLNSP